MRTQLILEQLNVLAEKMYKEGEILDEKLWMYKGGIDASKPSPVVQGAQILYWSELRGVLIEHMNGIMHTLRLKPNVLHGAVYFMDVAIMKSGNAIRFVFAGCASATMAMRKRLVKLSTACMLISAKMYACDDDYPEEGYIKATAKSTTEQTLLIAIERILFRAIESYVGKPTVWTAIPYMEYALKLRRVKETAQVALLCAKSVRMQRHSPVQRAAAIVFVANRAVAQRSDDGASSTALTCSVQVQTNSKLCDEVSMRRACDTLWKEYVSIDN